ncbi:MAG: protein kinase, partial [Planctomycetes bacterium]|nr:protein kinase [Planctomycetota bacterium]
MSLSKDNETQPQGEQPVYPVAGSSVPPHLAKLGEFELRREIGRGGMGTVYEAWQQSLQRRVALKVLHSQVSASPPAVARFQREARAAARLQHLHITSVYAQGEQDGVYYYAMEFVEGRGLNEIIAAARGASGGGSTTVDLDETIALDRALPGPLQDRPGGNPDPSVRHGVEPASSAVTLSDHDQSLPSGEEINDIVRHVASIADALDFAHGEGVVHRDIKPHNLLMGKDGRLKITDFGLARLAEQPGVTMTGEVLGSPLYMSYEQVVGDPAHVDHRTDIYSLGATIYEWLTLRPPYPGETRERVISLIVDSEPDPPRMHNAAVPQKLETVLLKSLERDRERRYQTASEFRDDLRRFLLDQPIKARRVGMLTKLRKSIIRHQTATVAVLAACVALVLSLALMSTWGVAGRRTAEAQRATVAAQEEAERATVAARVAREEADELANTFELLADVLPLEIGGLVSGAGAAAPVVQDIGSRFSIVAGSVRSGGANPGAGGTAERVAQRVVQDLYDAEIANREITIPAGQDQHAASLRQAMEYWGQPDRRQDAVELLNIYLAERPESFDALELRVALFGWLGQYEQMARDADSLAELRPDDHTSFLWTSLAYLLLGDTVRCLADVDHAEKLGGANEWVRTVRALGLIQAGRNAEGVAVLGDSPSLAVGMLAKAHAFAALGDVTSAVSVITRVIQLEPNNAAALAQRGRYYGTLGDFGAAAVDLQRAMDLGGSTPQLALELLLARAAAAREGGGGGAPDSAGTTEKVEEQADPPDPATDVSTERVKQWF